MVKFIPFEQKVSVLASKYSRIYENHHVKISYMVIVVLIFALEYLVEESELFPCPTIKEYALHLGLCLILGGAALLLMIGLLFCSQNWRACHGCYHTTTWDKKAFRIRCNHFKPLLLKAMIMPLTWVFAIGFDGDYIACMLMPEDCIDETEEYETLKYNSRLYSLYTLTACLTVLCLVQVIIASINKKNYWHHRILEKYRSYEEHDLFNSINVAARNRAEEIVRSLQITDMTEDDWITATDETQDLAPHLSPLHKYVMDQRGSKEVTSVKGHSSIEEEKPSTAEESSSVREEVPLPVKKSSSVKEEVPSTTEESSSVKERVPLPVKESSPVREEVPVKTKKSSLENEEKEPLLDN